MFVKNETKLIFICFLNTLNNIIIGYYYRTGSIMVDLKPLFQPKSIAVVGASQKPEKAGYVIIKNLLDMKYPGTIYPITPNYEYIEHLKAYPSISSLPKTPDLTVIAVNVNIANKIIEEAFIKDIPFLVVITAGYKEINTDEGLRHNKELEEIIKKYRKKGKKTRIVGPNCLGIYDNLGKVDLLFLPKQKMFKPKKGNIAFISQSGAIGAAFLDKFSNENIGLSRFVSYGNAIDLKEHDFLNHFAKDKETSCILSYIEGITNGTKFFESLKKASKAKPTIILKGGKSKKGNQATQSHTGSLAASYEVLKGILKQTKTIEAKNEEELYDFGKMFSFYPKAKPKSRNIGVITNGGGFGVICADMAEKYNLNLPELDKKITTIIKPSLPEYASIHNPLDLIGDANSKRYNTAIKAMIKDRNIDVILIVLLLQTFSLGQDIVYTIIENKKTTNKPIVVVSMGSKYSRNILSKLETKKIPVYETPERAIKTIDTYLKYKLGE